MAEEAKALGNTTFAAGDFTTAITHYTTAINLTPTNHLLYSNRSYAYYSLNNFSKALTDAEKTIQLKPDWSKGYGRLGASLLGLGCFDKAVTAYKDGLKLDPTNQVLKSGLGKAKSISNASTSSQTPNLFRGIELWEKLENDQRTKGYLEDPEFVKMMRDLQIKGNGMEYFEEPKMLDVMKIVQEMHLPDVVEDDEMGPAFVFAI